MTIRLIGQANDSGVGTHFYHYATALGQIYGLDQTLEIIDFMDSARLEQAGIKSQQHDINISFVGANLSGYFRGTNIQWTVFEGTRIPLGQRGMYDTHDVWLPSEWGRGTAIANGVDPNRIAVVPEGVDHNLFHPYLKPRETRPFRFLTIGKYEVRKSYDEIFTAFAETYGNDPAVELVIKSGFFQDVERKEREMRAHIASFGCDNIRLFFGSYSQFDISNLYRSCDCFVFPSKAEGWGLPLIEAAASGLPLITTNYSAHTEFLQHITSSCLFVDYDMGPVNCPEYKQFYPMPDGDWGQWAHPRVSSIADRMREAYEKSPIYRVEALKNSEIIRGQYSWAQSATKSLETLRKRNLV